MVDPADDTVLPVIGKKQTADLSNSPVRDGALKLLLKKLIYKMQLGKQTKQNKDISGGNFGYCSYGYEINSCSIKS